MASKRGAEGSNKKGEHALEQEQAIAINQAVALHEEERIGRYGERIGADQQEKLATQRNKLKKKDKEHLIAIGENIIVIHEDVLKELALWEWWNRNGGLLEDDGESLNYLNTDT